MKNTFSNVHLSVLAIVGVFSIAILSCSPKTAVTPDISEVEAPIIEEMTKTKYSGIDLSLMDQSVSPREDFFRYVNGSWLESTEIPGDRSRWGSFDELRKKSSNDVLAVLNEAIESNSYPAGTDQYKAATFYQTAMNIEAVNAAKLSALQPYFDKIESIKNVGDIQKYTEETIHLGSRSFLDFAIFPDLRNSAMNTAYITSGSLGLPERDYYLDDDADSQEIRVKYLAHVAKMLGFIGIDGEEAKKQAQTIMELEKKMAEMMLSKEESRNPTLLYNKQSISELQKDIPFMQWNGFFENLGVGKLDTIIVLQPKYNNALQNIVANSSIEDCKALLRWNELNNFAGYAHAEVEQANFDFYSAELRGVKEMRPRWERVLGTASSYIGEAIGKLYVDKNFPPEAKAVALDMVNNIKLAFADRINGLEWMTDETKPKAIAKLNNFTVKIGYPDKWKDYSTMDVATAEEGGSYISNIISARKWRHADMLTKMNKPVDKTEWGMSPQTVNAYYNPLNNEIVFPAAILQPPFFDFKADPAVNYGGIGAVIGHEMSHGFDDQGSRFDKDGNMTNWWEDEDRVQFEARNKKLIEQANNYEVLPDVFINGEFTLGENIGDLGGINTAYDGLMKYYSDKQDPGLIDGFTQQQRYFLSWATIWRTKIRDEALLNQIKTDPHAPGVFRANGPLTNLTSFYEAFDVVEGDAMYRSDEDRVMIW